MFSISRPGSRHGRTREGLRGRIYGRSLEDRSPLLLPLGISSKITGHHQTAVHIRERLQSRRLPAHRGSHRLVEPTQAAVHMSECDLCQAQLGEGSKFGSSALKN